MVRPARTSWLANVRAGRIDCVVVYKVDRLSRSLLDFSRIVGVFEEYGASFVSVTQQFNTNAPLGRLTLNIYFPLPIMRSARLCKATAPK
jgi:site-specific DNA recombinase